MAQSPSPIPVLAPGEGLGPTLMPTRDEILAVSKNAPELLANAKAYDPELFNRLQGESTAQAKTVWAQAITFLLVYLSGRYGLGWDSGFCGQLAGLLSLVATAVAHWIMNRPLLRHAGEPPPPPTSVLVGTVSK